MNVEILRGVIEYAPRDKELYMEVGGELIEVTGIRGTHDRIIFLAKEPADDMCADYYCVNDYGEELE